MSALCADMVSRFRIGRANALICWSRPLAVGYVGTSTATVDMSHIVILRMPATPPLPGELFGVDALGRHPGRPRRHPDGLGPGRRAAHVHRGPGDVGRDVHEDAGVLVLGPVSYTHLTL